MRASWFFAVSCLGLAASFAAAQAKGDQPSFVPTTPANPPFLVPGQGPGFQRPFSPRGFQRPFSPRGFSRPFTPGVGFTKPFDGGTIADPAYPFHDRGRIDPVRRFPETSVDPTAPSIDRSDRPPHGPGNGSWFRPFGPPQSLLYEYAYAQPTMVTPDIGEIGRIDGGSWWVDSSSGSGYPSPTRQTPDWVYRGGTHPTDRALGISGRSLSRVEAMYGPTERVGESRPLPPAAPAEPVAGPLERARVAQLAGRPDVAAAALREHLSERPDDLEVRRELGLTLMSRGDVGEGLTDLLWAYDLDPSLAERPFDAAATGFGRAALSNALSRVLVQAKRHGEGRSYFAAAVINQARGERIPARRLLERAEAAGHRTEATAALRAALGG